MPAQKIALEFKLAEPYYIYRADLPFTDTYLGNGSEGLWENLPNLKELAVQCNAQHSNGRKADLFGYSGLEMPQLIKTALGLRRKFGTSGWKLGLVWYEVLEGGQPTCETERMRSEIKFFTDRVGTEFNFFAITCREMFSLICGQARKEDEKYLGYIAERYFT
jgi:hypothetical protein